MDKEFSNKLVNYNASRNVKLRLTFWIVNKGFAMSTQENLNRIVLFTPIQSYDVSRRHPEKLRNNLHTFPETHFLKGYRKKIILCANQKKAR